jgi:hypothetical protein
MVEFKFGAGIVTQKRWPFSTCFGVCFFLTATILLLVARVVVTGGWVFSDDGLCDACGSTASYGVFEDDGSDQKVNEFCAFHALVWSFFNPWRKGALVEGILYLLATYIALWISLSLATYYVANRNRT